MDWKAEAGHERLQPVEGSSTKIIDLWDDGTNTGNDTNSAGIIGTLFDGLMSYLRLILTTLERRKAGSTFHRSLEICSAALLFWGKDHGVSNGNLDMILQHSDYLRDTVLTVLISIGESIIQGRLP
jgi:hypothetical protein